MTPQEAQAYLDANPDVAQAYASNNLGMSPEEFAQAHWTQYGAAEGRQLAPAPAVAQPALAGNQRSAGTQAPTIAQQTAKPLAPQLTPSERAAQARAADEQLWAQYQQQPWYADFQRASIPGGGWSYDPRADRWTNPRNDLIDRYGTTDIYEYAQRQGMAVPEGWRADPNAAVRDTSSMPTKAPGAFAGASERRDAIQQDRAAKEQGIGVRMAPGRQRSLIQGAQGVAPTPGKPSSEEVASQEVSGTRPSLVSRVLRHLGLRR